MLLTRESSFGFVRNAWIIIRRSMSVAFKQCEVHSNRRYRKAAALEVASLFQQTRTAGAPTQPLIPTDTDLVATYFPMTVINCAVGRAKNRTVAA